MTFLGWLFFSDKDNVIIEELMNLHKIDKSKAEKVKKHYEKMLEEIRNDDEIQD